jgi:RNA polymerase-binding transcription factor DksA
VPNDTVVAELRDSLTEERENLRAHLSELEAGNEKSLTFDENFADSGQVAAEQGEAKVLAASLREQLADVERALGKIDSGKYGKCEVCGDDIAEARLEAMPATRYCINHA